MNWSVHKRPDGNVSYYDHVLLESPLGTFKIEWKSWKESDNYSVILNDQYLGVGVDLSEAKKLVKNHLIDVSQKLIEFIIE